MIDLVKNTVSEGIKKIAEEVFHNNPTLKSKELIDKIYETCCNTEFVTMKSYKIQEKLKKESKPVPVIVERIEADGTKVQEKTFRTITPELPTCDFYEVLCPNNPQNIKSTFYRVFDASWLPRKNPFFHKEDNNKFVRATLKLFPNTDAYSFGNTLTVFRKFIENIYYNLGFEGLKPQQTLMYQFSTVGGTGKSEFNNRLRHFLNKMDIEYTNSSPKGRWVSAEYSNNLVALCDEWIPPRGYDIYETISKINNIVDDVEYKVEYKFSDAVMIKSICSLIFNSNYLPFDDNDRRYGIIKYNNINYDYISEEDKDKYFAYRTDDEWDKIFLEAFESCPFGKVWKDKTPIVSKDLNSLIDMARYVTEEAHLSNPSCATIGEFLKAYCRLKGDDNKESLKRMVRLAITKAVATGKIKVAQKVNGNLDYSKYDWISIANMPTSGDETDNPLNDIDNIFEKTVVSASSFLEEETLPPENDDKNKLSDGNLFVGKFVTESGDVHFTRCTTKNEMQEYVVVNKPLPSNDGTSRKDCDVEQDCFLLEIDGDKNDYPEFDEIHKEDGVQWKGSEEEKESANDAILRYMIPFIEENKKYLKWVCSSGRVSEHVVLKTNLPKNVVNSELRAFIFDKINKKWFGGRLDKQCKNACRLGRNPNAVRDNGNVQTAMFINEDCEALDVSQWINEYNKLPKKTYVKKEYHGNVRSIDEQFKSMTNKTKNPNGLLAFRLFKGEKVESGSNLIGAVAYCRTLKDYDDKWTPVYNKVLEEAKLQHPSNIGKNVR